MIICINKERVDAQDASKMRVVLQADTTEESATNPKNGANVQDVEDGAVFYAGSIMTCLQDSKTYIMNSAGEWVEWTA